MILPPPQQLPVELTAGTAGEVSEWLKEPVSKTGVPVRVPRVRIPPFPVCSSYVMCGVLLCKKNTQYDIPKLICKVMECISGKLFVG